MNSVATDERDDRDPPAPPDLGAAEAEERQRGDEVPGLEAVARQRDDRDTTSAPCRARSAPSSWGLRSIAREQPRADAEGHEAHTSETTNQVPARLARSASRAMRTGASARGSRRRAARRRGCPTTSVIDPPGFIAASARRGSVSVAGPRQNGAKKTTATAARTAAKDREPQQALRAPSAPRRARTRSP